MPSIRAGEKVKYALIFLQGPQNSPMESLVGRADRIIASSPPLVYVRWDDGSYKAVSERHLEAV